MDANLRAMNAAIARNYDSYIYDPCANPLLDAARVSGLASLFGQSEYPIDVLDLGCGTGAQLAHAASQVAGRIVGTDISAAACLKAEERVAPFGDRAQILCSDLLEITPEALGQFDLIYNVGVIYITPPEVQRHILEVIGTCLRPGGIAVLSYYAGSIPTLRANLHQTLRTMCMGLEPAAAIAHARTQLEAIAASLGQVQGADLQRRAVADTSGLSDTILFHEVLNNSFEAMRTTTLEHTLSRFGMSFAGYLPTADTGEGNSSVQRAIAADVADFRLGQYRYAVFAKYDAPPAVDFVARPDLWESNLTRPNRGEFSGEQIYTTPGAGVTATIRSPASMAMFDCLMDGPISWHDLTEKTAQTLRHKGMDIDDATGALMAGDLHNLWRHGAVYPLSQRP